MVRMVDIWGKGMNAPISYHWIKFWVEVIDDPKMGRLSDNLWRRFFECCALAGELNQDGRIPSVPDIAWRLRVDEETLRIEFDQLSRIGLLDHIAVDPLDHHWIVTNFDKRQSTMSAAERMRRKRKRDQLQDSYGASYETVTARNTEKRREEEEEEREERDTAAVFSHFSNNITVLSPALSDEIGDWIDSYPQEWIIEAIDIAVKRSKRRADYIKGILNNWKSNGKDDGSKPKKEIWAETHC